MSLRNIRTKLDAALAGVTGLNHSTASPSVITPPFAFPALRSADAVSYDFTAGNHALVYHFEITVLVATAKALEDAQDDMDAYLLPSGSSSIKAAVEAISWGTDADVCRVTGVGNYGPANYGGMGYLGARLNLDIWVSS